MPAGLASGGTDFAGLMAKPSHLAGDFAGGIIRSPNGPTVAGQRLTMGLRLAGNAGKFVGRAMFSSPAGLAAGALAWAASECVEYQGGKWKLTCGGTPPVVSDGYEYETYYGNGLNFVSGYRGTREAACAVGVGNAYLSEQAGGQLTGSRVVGEVCWLSNQEWGDNALNMPIRQRSRNGCPAGWYVLADGTCQQTAPGGDELTIDQMSERLANKPLPNGIDWTGWGNPGSLPVQDVILNPSPGSNPTPQTLRVPQGNPQPRPNTDPQLYDQPVTRITPAPTPGNPLRVDITGETSTGTSSTGLAGPEPVTTETPPGTPREDPPDPDICAKNPEILACAQLDSVDAPDLETEERGGPITPDSGWGAESASCPQPRVLTVQGRSIPIPYDLFCTYMSGIRPLVIAMAWLSAGFILLGRKGGD